VGDFFLQCNLNWIVQGTSKSKLGDVHTLFERQLG
jgi:hypothetical protein